MVLVAVLAVVVVLAGGIIAFAITEGNTATPSTPPTNSRCAGFNHLVSGTFYSHARHRRVGYTIGYPPGCRRRGLPLIIYLHGADGSHTDLYGGMTLQQAVSLRPDGKSLTSMAMVSVDGGRVLYWHKHSGDDPGRMVIRELIPFCRKLGLGVGKRRIAITGVSMGGYGAILQAEKHPRLFAAVAAVSPAVWTSFAASLLATHEAFTSASDFARNNIIAHAFRLRDIPVYMASGLSDPFRPYVESLAPALEAEGATIDISPGGHAGAFFDEKAPAALQFLSRRLGR